MTLGNNSVRQSIRRPCGVRFREFCGRAGARMLHPASRARVPNGYALPGEADEAPSLVRVRKDLIVDESGISVAAGSGATGRWTSSAKTGPIVAGGACSPSSARLYPLETGHRCDRASALNGQVGVFRTSVIDATSKNASHGMASTRRSARRGTYKWTKSSSEVEHGVQTAVGPDQRRHSANRQQRPVDVRTGAASCVVTNRQLLIRHSEDDLGADHVPG